MRDTINFIARVAQLSFYVVSAGRTTPSSTSAYDVVARVPATTSQILQAPTEIVQRQATTAETCGYIDDEPLTCKNGGSCVHSIQGLTAFVGCCSDQQDCVVRTGCQEVAATGISTATTEASILTCYGSEPYCATLSWTADGAVAFLCATTSATLLVNNTLSSTTASSDGNYTSLTPTTSQSATSSIGSIPSSTSGGSGSANMLGELSIGQRVGVGIGSATVGLVFIGGIT
ncbi:uncharacterized protein BDZ83DRAFT_617187 [Colletotrichum acutatum]|uniref:Uncharacterized protein n=1 Tax=Glomerella acutata TaxID=27357 RepID=A0AAD8UNP5_GLOAC|nr:uncharacterized protein BDZ83DRAFT_617187 [Colletotrichum acutatum]KAK1726112.1 hypothetical protein BDZ83DRAFT_617187 [Colletotrichum acutatum]